MKTKKKKKFFSWQKALVNFSLSTNDQAFSYTGYFLNEQICLSFQQDFCSVWSASPVCLGKIGKEDHPHWSGRRGRCCWNAEAQSPSRAAGVPAGACGFVQHREGCLEDKTLRTHSLEDVCCMYLPSDKDSSKWKTTWLFTEFKGSFLALELYKWLR